MLIAGPAANATAALAFVVCAARGRQGHHTSFKKLLWVCIGSTGICQSRAALIGVELTDTHDGIPGSTLALM